MASTSSSYDKDEEPVDPQVEKINHIDPAVGGSGSQPSGNPAEPSSTEVKKKKKKKVVIAVPDSDVRHVLSYKDEPVDMEVPDHLVRTNPKRAAVLAMMAANLAMYKEHTKGRMLEEQRDFKHQLKTKGRVTYELEVDEDDERFKDYESASSSAGAGRRKHRPGVMKQKDGQTKRLN